MNELDEPLVVTRSVRIPPAELEWRFSASGGPGGQNVNTSNTRVELTFDPVTSQALGPVQRDRVVRALGSPVRVVVASERSQRRNRHLARERLAERLAGALAVRTPRRATKPTAGSKRRRLDAKSRAGELKAQRSRRYRPDD